MQIFSTGQVHAWDEYTIQHEPIASVDLMERAATACFDWLMQHGYKGKSFSVFCSKGNNGGDGLAIARMLSQQEYPVTTYILEFGHKGTDDFQANLARLHETETEIRFISGEANIRPIPENDIVLDTLLGSGLNRPLDGLTARVVQHINASGNEVIAIDIPTGLFADKNSKGNTIIRARHTLSFQCYKTAFLLPENACFTGDVHILDIGLHPDFLKNNSSRLVLTDQALVHSILRPRKKFAHKGNFGHAALVTGSAGMMGAAVLGAKACLRSGAGKLTCFIPSIGYTIMQVAVPEAMCKTEEGNGHIQTISDLEYFDAVGIGSGIGLYETNINILSLAFQQNRKPMVIDADALNIISQVPRLIHELPPGSILTPHVKEFERLFGKTENDFERMEVALQKAAEYSVVIILKGHYSFIATPGGMGYFNSTGNPGMATGGTGDVLTGILTSLLAQGYTPEQAAIAGAYIHGLAGDLAAAYTSQTSLIASDIIDHLGGAFQKLV